jgi:hypothetical protein
VHRADGEPSSDRGDPDGEAALLRHRADDLRADGRRVQGAGQQRPHTTPAHGVRQPADVIDMHVREHEQRDVGDPETM